MFAERKDAMSWFKLNWLCRIFGHRFALVNDLRDKLGRERIVFRCLRCSHPLIIRKAERRHAQRRKTERREAFRGGSDRRNRERRKIYNSREILNLLHG